MRIEYDVQVLDDPCARREGRRNRGPINEVPHRHQEPVDEESVPGREIKVRMGCLRVEGEARDADRHDALGPGGAALFEGVSADPFDRHCFAPHGLDQITGPKILNAHLTLRRQDARASKKAMATTTAAVTPAIVVPVTAIRGLSG